MSTQTPDQDEDKKRPTNTSEAESQESSKVETESAEMIELSEDAAKLVEDLQRERDDAIEQRQRALADFSNFQRRASENERRSLQEGAVRAVRPILTVLDHFDLALGQNTDQLTVDQLIGGVRMVRDELYKALQTTGVERISPRSGEPFNPNQHEAMMREASGEVEPGHVVRTLQPGYRMGEQVLRPAKVMIAEESESPDDDSDGARE